LCVTKLRVLSIILCSELNMLSVIKQSFIMLSVSVMSFTMMSVIMLNKLHYGGWHNDEGHYDECHGTYWHIANDNSPEGVVSVYE
jgi:hypothetical protein